MSIIVLSRCLQSSKASSTALRFYHVGRAANVNTAIAKGIRKSNGVAFRGTEKPNDSRGRYLERNGVKQERGSIVKYGNKVMHDARVPRTDKPLRKRESTTSQGREEDKSFRELYDDYSAGKNKERSGSKRSSFKDSTERHGERDISKKSRSPTGRNAEKGSFSTKQAPWESRGRTSKLGFHSASPSADRRPARPRRSDNLREEHRERYPSLESKGKSYAPRATGRDDRPAERYPSLERNERKFDSKSWDRKAVSDGEPFSGHKGKSFNSAWKERNSVSADKNASYARQGDSFDSKPQYSQRNERFDRDSTNRSEKHTSQSFNSNQTDANPPPNQPRITNVADNRIPLSIPYTTPASEFLYGTSVVEAALSSRRIPARKLYKLYIYTGENREKGDQDADIEKLARKGGVPVSKVGSEWIRMLDKMSGGRPHNGYILEASPLPRLPITSLGQISEKDGLDGFEVTVDHQSKEDMTVNGTESFIRIPRNRTGRKPLVLFLDSILDPGNLGGIIRTASFLGVTAVAMSTRNCAPFSPVVLKASAGASENIIIFSVNKPSGFVVDSQAAGWKVYAAVAPSKKKDPDMPKSIATHKLNDPLSEHPCLLMLGGEGEGLRWNLRSKADADIYIQGSGESHKVDSLNVSVAAGVLCNSFLRSRLARSKEETSGIERSGDLASIEQTREKSSVTEVVEERDDSESTTKNLF